jgi:hypothetical protein
MKKKNPPGKTNDADLPGYPHYPPEEDILNTSENKTERIPVDIENISRNLNANTTIKAAGKPGAAVKEKETADPANNDIGTQNEADVTDEDLSVLGDPGLSMDAGDDEVLRNRPYPSVAGDDELDIPGAELDDAEENIGSEDEENNYYSLGGDNHDNLESQS